jgi:hypothetical protein
MKKMLKKTKINNSFWVLVVFFAVAIPSSMGTAFAAASVMDGLDQKIRALISPFLSKLPPPPPPPVEVKKEEPEEVVKEPVVAPPKKFVLPPPPKPSLPELILSGTILSKDNPRAIVNGKVLGIGDTIEGVKIVGIMRGEIDALFGGEHFLIRLSTGTLKKKK